MQFYHSTARHWLASLGLYVLAGFLALSLLFAGCDSNGGPPLGSLSVDVSTSGDNLDTDGYTVTIDDSLSREVDSDGSASFSEIEEGTHEVALSGLKANCAVDGSNPQPVTILDGDSAPVSFSVTCQNNKGAIEARVATSGSDVDSNGYTLTVDGDDSTETATTDTTSFTGLSEGNHEVALSGQKSNCSVGGANPRTVTVNAQQTTGLLFDVQCEKTTGAIEVTIQTTGDWPDADGYFVSIDGSDSTRTALNGRATIHNLQQGSHDVRLTDRRFNCTVSGDNPRSVSVSAGQTITASFELSCPPDLSGGLAFQTDRTGNPDIHAVGPDGTEPTQITLDSGGDLEPTVSPDGSHLGFSSRRDGNFEIYKTTPDGSVTQLTDSGSSDRLPVWGPDGNLIAFQSDRDGNGEIYTVKADGTSPNRITNDAAFDGAPTWKPDGSRIAFSTSRDGNAEIYTMKADGSDVTQVTKHSNNDTTPAWSPDGNRIAFASRRDGNFEIYTIKPDGSDLTRLTNDPARDIDPEWSPDGTRIAFWSRRDGNEEIYMIDPDGSNLKRFTDNPADDNSPAWGPSK